MSRKDSFTNSVANINPAVFLLQETHLRRKGNFNKMDELKGYEIFKLLRTESLGGGLVIGIKEEFNPVLISEGDDLCELITVEASVNNHEIRFITAYGPQETDKNRKYDFFSKLNEEICAAELAGKSVYIEMDANSKVGSEHIKGDPCEKPTENGKLLLDILEQHENLILLNSTNLCEGVITRNRTANDNIEKSVIDFVIISGDLLPLVTSMIIDENREFSIERIRKYNGKTVVTPGNNTEILVTTDEQFAKRFFEKQ